MGVVLSSFQLKELDGFATFGDVDEVVDDVDEVVVIAGTVVEMLVGDDFEDEDSTEEDFWGKKWFCAGCIFKVDG